MKKTKEKAEEMPEGFKLIIKWLFWVIGVPSLASILLYVSVLYSFEIAKSVREILIGIFLLLILIVYEVIVIIKLVEETKEYLGVK